MAEHFATNVRDRKQSPPVVLTLLLAIKLILATATAAADSAPEPACAGHPLHEDVVAAVLDGQTLQLGSGREVRLIGSLAPSAADTRASPEAWPLADAATAALRALALGKSVELRSTRRRTDRWNRELAQVFLRPDAADQQPVWLQAEMIRRGMARAYSLPEEPPCAAELFSVENEARNARRGLWANPTYAVRPAAAAARLRALRGTYQIIDGRISSIGGGRSRTYLNFGPDRWRDTTVALAQPVRRRLAQAGKDPAVLVGRRVRVRGWIEWRQNALLEIHDAWQIEVLAEDGTPSLAQRPYQR